MPLVRKHWDDNELEAANDASAAKAVHGKLWQISPSSFNALVCEVQAWRRTYPTREFASGPNEIVDK